MSFDALAWAARCNPGSPAKKLVLLSLAECAGREDCEAFPSIKAIAEFSSLNRKTIIAALDALEASGFIVDTGSKRGRTGQIKVYRLTLETIPKTEPFQKRNSSVSSAKESQKRDTELVREPVSNKKARAQSLSSDWQPQPFIDGQCKQVVASWSSTDLAAQVEHFTSHHQAKGSTFVDWQAAWRTWVLNSRKWATTRTPAPSNDAGSLVKQILARQANTP
jgi:hypothetical protein